MGNEMFGPWQLGFMPLHQYALKHNLVAKAMRAVAPSLMLSAVGAVDTINKANDPEQAKRGLGWTEGMLLNCAAPRARQSDKCGLRALRGSATVSVRLR